MVADFVFFLDFQRLDHAGFTLKAETVCGLCVVADGRLKLLYFEIGDLFQDLVLVYDQMRARGRTSERV